MSSSWIEQLIFEINKNHAELIDLLKKRLPKGDKKPKPAVALNDNKGGESGLQVEQAVETVNDTEAVEV